MNCNLQEFLRRSSGGKSQGGVSMAFVAIVGLIGIVLGYLLKRG